MRKLLERSEIKMMTNVDETLEDENEETELTPGHLESEVSKNM